MNPQEILSFVRNSLAQNKTKEDIYIHLLNGGCKVTEIAAAFEQAESGDEKGEIGKRAVKVLVLLGAILIGAGIFSFIASNWQEMTRPTKIATIVVAMLTAHAAGWFIREKGGQPKTGEALIFLGTVIYGSGIFLIAQMFHTSAIWPDGFILWLFGALAIGFAIESRAALVLAILLGFAALCGYPSHIFSFGRQALFLQTSSLLLLAATLATFWAGSEIRKKMPLDQRDL